MKEDVLAQIKESKTRSTSLLNDCIAMVRLKTISFPPTEKGLKDKKKYEERIEKVVAMIEDYKKYSTMDKYRDLYKEYLEKLRNEDDSKQFRSIYLEWEGKLLEIKFESISKHQELTTELRSLIMYVRDKKREEYNAMSESTNYTVEMYTEHADEIKRVIYEKCENGEISLEQREILLNRLNEYRLSTESCEDLLIRSMNEFMNDEITAEELDNVLVGCYAENAEVTRDLFGDDITEKYESLNEAVHQMYRAGFYDKKRARMMLERVQEAYEMEHGNRISEFLVSDDTAYEAVVERDSDVSTVTEFFYQSLENLDSESDHFYENMDAIFNEFCDDVYGIYQGNEQPMYEMTELAFFGIYMALLTAMIAIPIGMLVKTQKSNYKKFTKYYETIHKVPIPFNDIKYRRVDVDNVIEKFPKRIQDVVGRMDGNSTSLVTSVGGDSVTNAVGGYTAFGGFYKDKPMFYAITILSMNASPVRMYFLSVDDRIKKHEDYYKTCFSIKNGFMTPDVKYFLKTCLKEAKELEKQEAALNADKKEANKNASKVLKEYAEMDPSENTAMYEQVLEKIYSLYNEGALDLEQKEELILEARSKFFEAAIEGKSMDECMRIARSMVSQNGSVEAALKANDAKYKATMDECHAKMQECKKNGNKECYNTYYRKSVLASKEAHDIDKCLNMIAKEEKKKNSAFSKLKNKISGKASAPNGRPVPATESGCEEEAANCFDVFRNGEERSSSMRSTDRPKENCFDAFRNGESRSSRKERERKPGVSWDYENRDKEKKKENCFDVFKTGKKEESCDGGSGCGSDADVVEEMPAGAMARRMQQQAAEEARRQAEEQQRIQQQQLMQQQMLHQQMMMPGMGMF